MLKYETEKHELKNKKKTNEFLSYATPQVRYFFLTF